MLTLKRHIIGLRDDARTPMLVPSFSSKSGATRQGQVEVDRLGEVVTSPVLISAYDLFYEMVQLPSFAATVFIDSGGYEALKDVEAARSGDKTAIEEHPWTEENYRTVLTGLRFRQPFVAVSFDHPNEPLSLPEQIVRAERLFPVRTDLVKEFLIKPEPTEDYVDSDTIIGQIRRLADFPIIGLTDKELGSTMMERLVCVGRVRQAFQKLGIETPIHIFGSLDPLTAPLYFLAGADVFDGLAWLRYGFSGGRAIYPQNFEAVELDLHQRPDGGRLAMWYKNYFALVSLEDEMKRFLKADDFSCFGPNSDVLRNAWTNLDENLGA
jgi:hypothetical protein